LNDCIKEALDLAGAMQGDSEALLREAELPRKWSADRFIIEFFSKFAGIPTRWSK
jgi:hypothetical protein